MKVGVNIKLPKNTVIINVKGHSIYPSFIDLYLILALQNQNVKAVRVVRHNTLPVVKVFIGTTTSDPNKMQSIILNMTIKRQNHYLKLVLGWSILTYKMASFAEQAL